MAERVLNIRVKLRVPLLSNLTSNGGNPFFRQVAILELMIFCYSLRAFWRYFDRCRFPLRGVINLKFDAKLIIKG